MFYECIMDLQKHIRMANNKFNRGIELLEELSTINQKDRQQHIIELWKSKINESEFKKCSELKNAIERDQFDDFDKIFHCCEWVTLSLFFCKSVNFVVSGRYRSYDIYFKNKAIHGLMRCAIMYGAKKIIVRLHKHYGPKLNCDRLILYISKYNLNNWKDNKISISELTLNLDIEMKWQDFVLNAIELKYEHIAILCIDNIEDKHQKILECAAKKGYINIIRKILEKGNFKLKLENVYDIALANKNDDIIQLLNSYSIYLFPCYWNYSCRGEIGILKNNHHEKLEKLYQSVIQDDIIEYNSFFNRLDEEVKTKIDKYNRLKSSPTNTNEGNDISTGVCLQETKKELEDSRQMPKSCIFMQNKFMGDYDDIMAYVVKLRNFYPQEEVNYVNIKLMHKVEIVTFLHYKMTMETKKRKRIRIILEDIIPNNTFTVSTFLLLFGLAFINGSVKIMKEIKNNDYKINISKLFYDANFY